MNPERFSHPRRRLRRVHSRFSTPTSRCVRLPNGVDSLAAAAIGCRYMTAYHAVMHQGGVLPGGGQVYLKAVVLSSTYEGGRSRRPYTCHKGADTASPISNAGCRQSGAMAPREETS